MIIRINRTEKQIILDFGSMQEAYWYDELRYCDEEIDVYRQGSALW